MDSKTQTYDWDELIEPVCTIADLSCTKPGSKQHDKAMNDLINAARAIRDRQGFLVITYKAEDFA